jgi:beta-lactamase regulating signal transducer with metallopeptidase domain
MNVAGLHALASVAFERMVYSLVEGTLLTLLLALALRMLPVRASQTRFVIWLSALLGIVAATVGGLRGTSGVHADHAGTLVTLPVSFALAAFGLWVAFATVGLLRIAAGLWQLRRMREQCVPVKLEELPPSARTLLQAFQKVRPVAVLKADDSQSPKAVGFFSPAIILPAWLLNQRDAEDIPAGEELKHVLLHELAHLRRRDDWTNLLQQVIKAVFFFHPAVWWMERELALSREQACDDAALEQAADARDYARSLALVAEKSFMRRQLALAQAVLGRAHQLTQRVTRILDPNRPTRGRLWKPAVPLVAVATAVCALSASFTPELVRIQDSAPVQVAAVSAAKPAEGLVAAPANANREATQPLASFGVKAWPAKMTFGPARHPEHKAGLKSRAKFVPQSPENLLAKNVHPEMRSPMMLAMYSGPESAAGNHDRKAAPTAANEMSDGLVVVVATQETIVADRNGWHVEVSQVRWVVPAKAFYKPAPNKT